MNTQPNALFESPTTINNGQLFSLLYVEVSGVAVLVESLSLPLGCCSDFSKVIPAGEREQGFKQGLCFHATRHLDRGRNTLKTTKGGKESEGRQREHLERRHDAEEEPVLF